MSDQPRAIVIREYGDSDVLGLENVIVPPPGPDQLRLRQVAIGVNYHDVYVRSGLYRTLALPGIPGLEAVGVVEALGDGVTGFSIGERVAYLQSGYGAYASERIVDAVNCVPLPNGIADTTAAAVFLKGVTATILAELVHPVRSGETVLVHAAAGGVGSLLTQWAAHLGARVIGTVGSAVKAALAVEFGCTHVVNYNEDDFAARVMQLTGGRGVDVVYDAVGRDTFAGSLAVLAVCGHLVNYGQSSGPVAPLEMTALAPRSLTISRPAYAHYVREPGELRRVAARLFKGIEAGILSVPRFEALSLGSAAQAHARLEKREGPFVLAVDLPD